MERPTHLVSIGNNIRQMREHRGFTMEQLGDLAGLRKATINDIENGKSNFEINTLVRIASALNVYLDISLTPIE